MAKAEPSGGQCERVDWCELGIEVRRQRVEQADDRIEHVLERADKAHREIVVAVEVRQSVSQIATVGRGRRDWVLARLGLGAHRRKPLAQVRDEPGDLAGAVDRLPTAVDRLPVAVGHAPGGWSALTTCVPDASNSSGSSAMWLPA